jgi:hypothetical protein
MGAMLWIFTFLSISAVAKEQDWLSRHLKTKSIQCKLTHDQLKEQVKGHAERNLREITESLKQRGATFEIVPDPEHLEIGDFPNARSIDFYVLEIVTVFMSKNGEPIRNYPFKIQTLVFTGEVEPTIEHGLWFPLRIKNPNSDNACVLERLSVSEEEKKFQPVVNLMFGNLTVAEGLASVVDVGQPPVVDKPERRKKEAEQPSRRRQRRRRKSRARKAEAERRELARRGPPERRNPCADGDRSAWQSVSCVIKGNQP